MHLFRKTKAALVQPFWKHLLCQASGSNPKTDSQRIEEAPLLPGPSGHISAQTLAHPKGAVSLLPAAAISEGCEGAPSGPGPRAWLGLTLLVLVHRTSMSIASSVPRPFMAFCSCRASYSLGRSSSAKAVFLKCPLSSLSSTSCRSCRKTAEALALNGLGGEGQGSALPPHGLGAPTMGTRGVIETGALWTQ